MEISHACFALLRRYYGAPRKCSGRSSSASALGSTNCLRERLAQIDVGTSQVWRIDIQKLADTAAIMYNDRVKTTRPVRGLYRFLDVPETGRVGSAADGGADGGGSSGLQEMAEALQEAGGAQRAAAQSRHRADKVSLAGLHYHPSATQQLLIDVARSAGVSSWLTAEPRLAHGTVLNASDFRDALALRYGLQLLGIASTCVYGHASTIDHLLTCPAGRYPSARHDNVHDILAETLSKAVRDVETEPRLRPLSGEDLPYATANQTDEARLDIRAWGFWTRQQDAYFNVRVPTLRRLCCPVQKSNLGPMNGKRGIRTVPGSLKSREALSPLLCSQRMGWRGRSAHDSWRHLPVGSRSAIKTSSIQASSVHCVLAWRSASYGGQ